MNKTKTKNLKESEFIRHIENNSVVSTTLCEKYGISTETIAYALYVHSNSYFLKNDYVLDDIHYDLVKNNLIIIKPTLKQYYRRTRQVNYNGCAFLSGIKEYQDYCILLTLCCYNWIADVFTIYDHSEGSQFVVDVANDLLKRSIDYFSVEHENVINCFNILKEKFPSYKKN
ncbi:hypothetical protein [Klebsiella pneumoniae]|uniref:hypothetical protein n=1 Tax=Klebsiella pneumoniae TaxID=573 RepID=UPI002658F8DE|nr:hypothetical protein [Klebsiella pneumoniae]